MTITQLNGDDYHFPVSITPLPIGDSNTTSPIQIRTVELDETSYTGSYQNYIISLDTDSVFENLTPSVCSLIDGVASRLVSGTARIKVSRPKSTQYIPLNFTSSNNYTSQVITGFVDGSIGHECNTSLITSLDDEKDSFYYNGSTYSACVSAIGGIQRNPNCWAADFDLSGIPVSHLYGGFNGGGALVTPRHLVVCHHYEPGNKVGMLIRFVGNDGSIHTRTVIAQSSGSNIIINPWRDSIGDVAIFLLSGPDLPDSVTTYPVVGDWYPLTTTINIVDNIIYRNLTYDMCYLTVNQFRQVKFTYSCRFFGNYSSRINPDGIGEINGHTFSEITATPIYFGNTHLSSGFNSFRSNPITGDSGSPVFLPLPDFGLAFCCPTTTGDFGSGCSANKLNAMILDVDDNAGISTNHTVTVAPNPTL